MKQHAFFLSFIVIACFLITQPFFKEGYFPTDDGEWAIVRLAEMKSEIKDLQIPPRWSGFLNHGYGYPLFNFVYPFPYYLGLIPNLLGFNLTESIKILFVLSIFLSGTGMYLLGKYLKDEWTGIIASIFYLVIPYRIANLYERGSLGEVLSGGIFPFLVLFSILFIRKGSNIFYLLSSLFLFFILLSHNVSALFFIPVLIIISALELFGGKKEKYVIIRRTFFILVSGFTLSSYFIIPAILEKKNILLSVIPLTHISEYFLSFSSIVGVTVSKERPLFQIGIFHALSFCLVLLVGKVNKKLYSISILSILLFFYILMMTPILRPLWNLPFLSSIDFPWRLLGPISFLISFILIFLAESKQIKIVLTVLAVFSLLWVLPYVKINTLFVKNDTYYTSNDATTTSTDELMPVWVLEKPTERYQNKIEFLKGLGNIHLRDQKSNYLKATIDTSMNSQVQVNTIYYPGWEYKINGVIIKPILTNKNGTVIFNLSRGYNMLEGTFKETPLRLVSDLISIFSAISILLTVIWLSRKNVVRKYSKQ